MKTEKEWICEQLSFCYCFLSIPQNSKEHKEIVKCEIEMFEKRLEELKKQKYEEWLEEQELKKQKGDGE